MQYWFFLQRIFTVLVVILAWNLRVLPLLGLNAMFKRRKIRKELFFLIDFGLYGWKIFQWERKAFFLFFFGSAVVCFKGFFLFAVKAIFLFSKIPPLLQSQNFLFIGTLQNPNEDCRIKMTLQIIFLNFN